MSFISDVKELIVGANVVTKQMDSSKKIAKVFRVTAALVIVFILFLDYWNIMELVSWKQIPMWDEELCDYIKTNILWIICFGIGYEVIIEKLFRWLAVYVETEMHVNFLPVWFTIDDFIGICIAIFCLLYGMNSFIEFCNGYNVLKENEVICAGAILYLASVFVRWLYIQNRNRWYYIKREYTDYYDCEGKRIPKGADVVYYGKRYQVYCSGDVGLNVGKKKKEWRIISRDYRYMNDFSLEEAAKDTEGRLTLDKWKWGEKDVI